jgi:hypothetical protein
MQLSSATGFAREERAMPIKNEGWEMHIVRKSEQRRDFGRVRVRTVGTYQVFHDGVARTGFGMKGTVAETRGPGANEPENNGRRVEEGRYPLATQDGTNYKTWNFRDSEAANVLPKPGFELLSTGERTEILVHPGNGFLSSVGCINPCASLPNATEGIDYVPSRKRVIALIEDMKSFVGTRFPRTNGRKIPGAFVVIDGEP